MKATKMKSELALVVGASGTVGGDLLRRLQTLGLRTRATTSKRGNLGDGQVHVDLVTGEGIKEAFEGADRAFLLSPPGYANQHALLSPLIQEAKRRGLKKVVLMTAIGVDANEASPFRKAELELEKSGLNYNIIRPNWFMQNFNTFWIQGINAQNKILLPAGTAKTSFIDARDISAVAANLLVSEELNNQAFNLTGPEALDHDQVAAQISNVTNRKIEYVEIQPSELKMGLLAGGLPEDYAELLLILFGFLREGYNAAVTSDVQKIMGRSPLSFTQYTNDFKKSWN
ncbi:MAG: hypothetical protein A4S09_16995 [Proteobacteria bacterium SG_bin7]|nr:MAG: hypothetical protein A4S09_16995 [Proteobacteria bacterium SG_bin7]